MALLNNDQKQQLKGAVADKLISTVAKPLLKRLGDRMEKSKRTFIRNAALFFRGKL